MATDKKKKKKGGRDLKLLQSNSKKATQGDKRSIEHQIYHKGALKLVRSISERWQKRKDSQYETQIYDKQSKATRKQQLNTWCSRVCGGVGVTCTD